MGSTGGALPLPENSFLSEMPSAAIVSLSKPLAFSTPLKRGFDSSFSKSIIPPRLGGITACGAFVATGTLIAAPQAGH